ncbi:hypothetical protein JCM8097_003540 [Rhodosporidiobolus ruineniae]
MPDVRLRWLRKFSYMSPETFQAAQETAKRKREEDNEADSDDADVVDDNGQADERRAYRAKDFRTRFASKKRVDEWFARYPAVSKRNFYVVQNHNATRPHFDLRLQLDGKTVSWAIPKKLINLKAAEQRLAVETPKHPISYTFVEGSDRTGRMTTGVWDIGTYTILETKNKATKKAKKRQAGLYDDETTDEEGSVQEDEKQEDLFRDAYYYASFQGTPAVPGRPGLPVGEDTGRSRGFVVELNGERYKGLRLTFRRRSNMTRSKKRTNKKTIKKSGEVKITRDYVLTFSTRSPSIPLSKATVPSSVLHPDQSLLTGRTLDQIRTDTVGWLQSLLDDARDSASEEDEADFQRREERREELEGVLNGGGGFTKRRRRRTAKQIQRESDVKDAERELWLGNDPDEEEEEDLPGGEVERGYEERDLKDYEGVEGRGTKGERGKQKSKQKHRRLK